jgi:methionyl-tRNA formyltransferase
MPLRLIFMGTPDFAVPTLLDLVAHGHRIAAVYTRAAKPGGRGMKLQLSHEARLFQPACLAVAALAGRSADQPSHHGRRPRDRRDGDEDGFRA